MMRELTLGSLFSGSGGFELAGQLAGIKPIWQSEIEPFAIAVEKKNFPDVKHYGDVSGLSGAELEPVDIITFGSPCQGLSLAGKRKGLKDDRSGLYVEAVRIIKEMLEATDGKYPKFCVFENVPGLLSSNEGQDFTTCLDMMQELGFIPDANILDSQFMGVPQRRKRVYITWAQVDYILRKRMPLSDSITLQLPTEILLMNLAGLLKAYGIEPTRSDAIELRAGGNGVRRRMNLFSLQREDRLLKLRQRLDEIQATHSIGQKNLGLSPGEGQTAEIMSTIVDTKLDDSITESQSMSIGQLLKSSLEEGLQIESGCTTLIWTKETINQKIYTCFKALLNMLDVTVRLMDSLEEDPMSLNCFEWVRYILTEMREFTNALRKHEKGLKKLAGNDLLWTVEQKLQKYREQVEHYLTDRCGCEILFESEGLSGYSAESFRSRQRAAGDPPSGSGATGICLNDQGGDQMDVGGDVSYTLRAETHGHPPCVLDEPLKAAGFCTEHSAASRSIGYEEEVSPTLRTETVPAALALENHGTDSRVRIEEGGTVQTLTSRMGTGGNNVPLVMEEQKAYGIGGFNSEGMKSGNPKAGFYEAETSRTLDTAGGNPSCQQGGITVVSRSCTMTTGSFIQTAENLCPTLMARDFKDPVAVVYGLGRDVYSASDKAAFAPSIAEELQPTTVSRGPGAVETEYTVRRLTPTECARLQGFPDWWCRDLGTENPTEEDLQFWADVWETHRRLVSHAGKPKTEKQLRKWLADPYTEAAEYKLWGNGIALPCAYFVLAGIVYYAQFPPD